MKNSDSLRSIEIIRGFTKHAEGSVLITCGDTKVICTASVSEGVPSFKRDSGEGWLIAEYGMLPRSTHSRMNREAAKGKQSGRTVEIGRLIGRSLRAAVDMVKLGENTINIDCDVIQADGGTRCASITGGMVALYDALLWMKERGIIEELPLKDFVAAVSVGIIAGEPVLDLCYVQDSNAEVDMNVVMTGEGKYVEIQGTAEGEPFSNDELETLKNLAGRGITELITMQKQALGL